MKTAIAIRHVAFEHMGHFEAPLREAGYDVLYLCAGVDDLSPALDCDVLVICGGPISVNDTNDYPFITAEINIIKSRLAALKPVFGICLGAQLICRALNAPVYPGRQEIGWMPINLTEAGMASPLGATGHLPLLHWHGETFDLPDGAVHLASTPGNDNQAFAIGNHCLALQFHLEVRAQDLPYWLVGHAIEIADAPDVSVKRLREDTAQFAPQLEPVAKTVFADWLSRLPENTG